MTIPQSPATPTAGEQAGVAGTNGDRLRHIPATYSDELLARQGLAYRTCWGQRRVPRELVGTPTWLHLPDDCIVCESVYEAELVL